jgi:hypothetical protein
MYPHERSLVEKLAGKPFVLLGVNSDADRKELQKILQTEKITWRSWWDQGSIDGPIHKQWNVIVRPTVYLIDPHGVIRYKDVTGRELDEAIEAMMKEVGSKQ